MVASSDENKNMIKIDPIIMKVLYINLRFLSMGQVNNLCVKNRVFVCSDENKKIIIFDQETHYFEPDQEII